MPAIEGRCLCGAVRLGAARRPRSVTQCNCSICRRYGTLWAYYLRRDISIKAPRGGLATWAEKRGRRRFVRCATCGCITTWELERGPSGRLGINARLFDHAAIANVPVTVLDGDKTWRVLERYRKPGMLISPAR